MSEKSPLFISSMELLGHALELLEINDDKKYKFIVLHLSNAVELLLKDMVIDIGQSIFDSNNKNTIVVWKAFSILESHGVQIKQRPHIEILIDDRNVIQHKFGYPSRETVLYYIEFVIDLFRSCMHERYSIEFDEIAEEYFSENGLKLIGLGEKDVFSKIDAIAKYDKLSAISTAYSLLEQKLLELLGHDDTTKPVMIWHDNRLYSILKLIDPKLLDNKRPREYFDSIRQLRNISVHRQHHKIEDNEEQMNAGLKKIKDLYKTINNIPKSDINNALNSS